MSADPCLLGPSVPLVRSHARHTNPSRATSCRPSRPTKRRPLTILRRPHAAAPRARLQAPARASPRAVVRLAPPALTRAAACSLRCRLLARRSALFMAVVTVAIWPLVLKDESARLSKKSALLQQRLKPQAKKIAVTRGCTLVVA